MLPSEFDLADIRHTLTGLFASFYAPEVSHYAVRRDYFALSISYSG